MSKCLSLLYLSLLLLLAPGCLSQDISSESTAPSNGSDDQPSVERAVFMSNLGANTNGTIFACSLNPALVGSGRDIPVFIEFEGTEIQRLTIADGDSVAVFNRYNPSVDGYIVCVIEYDGAEFDSEAFWVIRR